MAAAKRVKLGHSLHSWTEINSTSIKDLDKRPATIKCIQEKTGNALDNVNDTREINCYFTLRLISS